MTQTKRSCGASYPEMRPHGGALTLLTRRTACAGIAALIAFHDPIAAAEVPSPGPAPVTGPGRKPQEGPMALDYLHIGQNGELFFAGLHQRLIQAYRYTATSLTNAWLWQSAIRKRADHAEGCGATFTLMIVPEKLTIYPDRVAAPALTSAAAPSLLVQRALRLFDARPLALDLVAPFRNARDATAIYPETDSHWTHAGAHLAYHALCTRFQTTPNPHLVEGRVVNAEPFSGDLGRVIEPARFETVVVRDLTRDATRVHTNEPLRQFEERGQALGIGEGSNVVYRNAAAHADPRKLVIFGDSYCHHNPGLRSGMLTQMLAETFREVHFIWNKSYDPHYVERVGADLVLCEIAERYLFKLPSPTFSQSALDARADDPTTAIGR